MTVAADIRHGIDAGRGGAVTTVAAAARRRGELPLLGQHLVMNTLLVLLKLIGGDLVVFHVFSVTVAAAASLSDLDRICPGRLVLAGTDSMDVMATGTDGDLQISFAKLFAMETRIVFLYLVCPNGRIKLPHIDWIAVALPTGFRDRAPIRFAQEPFGRTVALRLVADCGLVTAVAVLAAQSTRQVVIVFNLQGRTAEALLF
jgi:hypothetical protein